MSVDSFRMELASLKDTNKKTNETFLTEQFKVFNLLQLFYLKDLSFFLLLWVKANLFLFIVKRSQYVVLPNNFISV